MDSRTVGVEQPSEPYQLGVTSYEERPGHRRRVYCAAVGNKPEDGPVNLRMAPRFDRRLLEREQQRRTRARLVAESRERRARARARQRPRRIALERTSDGRLLTVRARSQVQCVVLYASAAALVLLAFVGSILLCADVTAAVRFAGEIWWCAAGLAFVAGACVYRWPVHVLLTHDAYAIYRISPKHPLRVGPRHELSVRNVYWYGPRLRISVRNRFSYEFWGLHNPEDRAAIDGLRANGRP